MIAVGIDRQLDIEIAILILVTIGVAAILGTGGIIITMMARQRRDLAYNRRISTALIDLSVQLEHEERRSRHAIKNLCYALTGLLRYWTELPVKPDFTSIAESLEEPPELRPAGKLIHDLVDHREVEEAAGR